MSNFGFLEKADYIPGVQITNTVLTSNVATYTVTPSFATGLAFAVGALVSVVNTTNGGGVLNVTSQPITAITANTFSVAITSANIPSAPDTGAAFTGKQAEIPSVQSLLASGSDLGTPNFITAWIDDNAGNITFRFLPVPDQTYRIGVIFQNKIPALMTGTSSLWAPIPDHYSLLYQWGFLAMVCAYFEDPRWAQFSQKFVAAVLGMAEGLDENQRDTFQKTWLDMVSEQQARSISTSRGVQSKGV